MGLDYNALKPKDLSHLVDSRIGNPEASGIDVLSGWDFTDAEWVVRSGGIIVDSNTFGGIGSNDGVGIDNVLTVGKEYLIHVIGNNAGTNFDISSFGGVAYYTHIQTGAFDLVKVFTAIEAGFSMRIDGVANCDITTLEIVEYNGEELIPDADVGFVANDVSKWTAYGTNTIEQDGNAVKITYVDNGSGAYNYLRQTTNGTLFNNVSVGTKYRIVVRAKVNSGSTVTLKMNDGVGDNTISEITNTEYQVFYLDYTALDTDPLLRFGIGVGEIVWLEVISHMKVTGLVAAYNMIPNGDTLVDISGNGNDGSISPYARVVTDNGGLRTFRKSDFSSRIYVPDLDHSEGSTLAVTFTPHDLENHAIWGAQSSTTRYGILYNGGVNIAIRVGAGGTASFACPYKVGVPITMVFVWKSGVLATVYANGRASNVDLESSTASYIRYLGATTGAPSNVTYQDFRLYNYPFSEQEAQDYHNQFAKQVEQLHRFDDLGVGSTI